MTTWRKFFQSVFIRQIEGHESTIPLDSIFQPMMDVDIFRFVAIQHFNAAKEHEQLAIEYSEYHALMVDELRFGGCKVIMQVDANGKLCYRIAADVSGKVA